MIKSIGQDAKVKQKDILVDIIKLIAKVITKLYKSCLSQSFKTSSPAKVGRVSRSNQETESTSEISAEGTIITKGNSLRQRGREEAGWSETVSNTAQSRAREGQCPAFPFLLPPLLAQGTELASAGPMQYRGARGRVEMDLSTNSDKLQHPAPGSGLSYLIFNNLVG